MSETMPVQELLWEGTAQITGQTDFGTTLQQVVSGEKEIPPGGLRIDFHYEGEFTGPRMNGTIVGTNYMLLQPDSKGTLHQHGVVTTDDGARLALFGDGFSNGDRQAAKYQQHMNIALQTTSEKYAWVNGRQFWQINEVDLSTGKVTVIAYMA
jgi:hypothetical protein